MAQREQRERIIAKHGEGVVTGGEAFLLPPRKRRRRMHQLLMQSSDSGKGAGSGNQRDSTTESLSGWSFSAQQDENLKPSSVRRNLFEGYSTENSPTTSQSPSRTGSWGASYITPAPKKRESISALQFPSPSSPLLSLRPSAGRTSSSASGGFGGLGEIGSPSPHKRFPPSRLSTISQPDGDGDDEEEASANKSELTPSESQTASAQKFTSDGTHTPCSTSSHWDSQDGDNHHDDSLEEFWGCLPATTVLRYEERIEEIRCEIDDLDIEGLKSAVLSYTRPLRYPLSDPSAVIAATTLQLLPPLARLTNLLAAWAVRIAVLKIIPLFLKWLEESEMTLTEALQRISQEDEYAVDAEKEFSEEEYQLLMEALDSKIVTAGRIMDMMLDALSGREDTLPDDWITRMEALEEGYSQWVVDGERLVLETRLLREQREEEEEARARDRRRMMLARRDSLMWEREKVREEAKVEEERVLEVVRRAEERVGGLREVLDEAERAAEEVGEGVDEDHMSDHGERDGEGSVVGDGIDEGGEEGKSLLDRIDRVVGKRNADMDGDESTLDSYSQVDTPTTPSPTTSPRGRSISSPHYSHIQSTPASPISPTPRRRNTVLLPTTTPSSPTSGSEAEAEPECIAPLSHEEVLALLAAEEEREQARLAAISGEKIRQRVAALEEAERRRRWEEEEADAIRRGLGVLPGGLVRRGTIIGFGMGGGDGGRQGEGIAEVKGRASSLASSSSPNSSAVGGVAGAGKMVLGGAALVAALPAVAAVGALWGVKEGVKGIVEKVKARNEKDVDEKNGAGDGNGPTGVVKDSILKGNEREEEKQDRITQASSTSPGPGFAPPIITQLHPQPFNKTIAPSSTSTSTSIIEPTKSPTTTDPPPSLPQLQQRHPPQPSLPQLQQHHPPQPSSPIDQYGRLPLAISRPPPRSAQPPPQPETQKQKQKVDYHTKIKPTSPILPSISTVPSTATKDVLRVTGASLSSATDGAIDHDREVHVRDSVAIKGQVEKGSPWDRDATVPAIVPTFTEAIPNDSSGKGEEVSTTPSKEQEEARTLALTHEQSRQHRLASEQRTLAQQEELERKKINILQEEQLLRYLKAAQDRAQAQKEAAEEKRTYSLQVEDATRYIQAAQERAQAQKEEAEEKRMYILQVEQAARYTRAAEERALEIAYEKSAAEEWERMKKMMTALTKEQDERHKQAGEAQVYERARERARTAEVELEEKRKTVLQGEQAERHRKAVEERAAAKEQEVMKKRTLVLEYEQSERHRKASEEKSRAQEEGVLNKKNYVLQQEQQERHNRAAEERSSAQRLEIERKRMFVLKQEQIKRYQQTDEERVQAMGVETEVKRMFVLDQEQHKRHQQAAEERVQAMGVEIEGKRMFVLEQEQRKRHQQTAEGRVQAMGVEIEGKRMFVLEQEQHKRHQQAAEDRAQAMRVEIEGKRVFVLEQEQRKRYKQAAEERVQAQGVELEGKRKHVLEHEQVERYERAAEERLHAQKIEIEEKRMYMLGEELAERCSRAAEERSSAKEVEKERKRMFMLEQEQAQRYQRAADQRAFERAEVRRMKTLEQEQDERHRKAAEERDKAKEEELVGKRQYVTERHIKAMEEKSRAMEEESAGKRQFVLSAEQAERHIKAMKEKSKAMEEESAGKRQFVLSAEQAGRHIKAMEEKSRAIEEESAGRRQYVLSAEQAERHRRAEEGKRQAQTEELVIKRAYILEQEQNGRHRKAAEERAADETLGKIAAVKAIEVKPIQINWADEVNAEQTSLVDLREAERRRLEAEAEAEERERQRQEAEQKKFESLEWEEHDRLRQKEDVARIARLAELAWLEDERVQKMDEQRRLADLELVSPQAPPKRAQRIMSSNDEGVNGGSDDGSLYPDPQTPPIQGNKPEIEMTPGASTVYSFQGDEDDDTGIIHSVHEDPAAEEYTGAEREGSVIERSWTEDDERDSGDDSISFRRPMAAFEDGQSGVGSSSSSVIIAASDSEAESGSERRKPATRRSSSKVSRLGNQFALDLGSILEVPSAPSTIRPIKKSRAPVLEPSPFHMNNAAEGNGYDDRDPTPRGKVNEEEINALENTAETLVKPRKVSRVPTYDLGPQVLRKNRSPSRSPTGTSPVQIEPPLSDPFSWSEPSENSSVRSPVEVCIRLAPL